MSLRSLDAIIVPTVRPQLLRPATALANEIGCELVVLCSTSEQTGQVLEQGESAASGKLVTYVPRSREYDLASFRASAHSENKIEHVGYGDIARKRNVGLMLARLCGWRAIMFLDDDIRNLTANAVSRATALAGRFQAVGFKISYYPDNSVVCHAYRLAGGKQDTFLSGSALIIDVERTDTLFPSIYNEDWLFLFDGVQLGSVAAWGTLSQLEYLPFARPRRAACQEFGDVIAEGLYRLIHEKAVLADATSAYWQGALQSRFQLIDHVAARLLTRNGDDPMVGYALTSLAAARKRLSDISAPACVAFIRAWRADLDAGRHMLHDLPSVGNLAAAARYLGLPLMSSSASGGKT